MRGLFFLFVIVAVTVTVMSQPPIECLKGVKGYDRVASIEKGDTKGEDIYLAKGKGIKGITVTKGDDLKAKGVKGAIDTKGDDVKGKGYIISKGII